jgi:phosphatidate phosphatase PAH1
MVRRMQNGADTMRQIALVITLLCFGCSVDGSPVGTDPNEDTDAKADGTVVSIPDVKCTGTPNAGPKGSWRHGIKSPVISALGSPKHRGFDLLVAAEDSEQTIAGAVSYTIADKALEDENVDLFACRSGTWKKLGTARTDDEGRFALTLSGSSRLPIGVRDLYVSVVGDRTGTNFLGVVAPAGTPVVVSDVDGTLTSSENAFLLTAVRVTPDAHPHAAAAFQAAKTKHELVIYTTARGQQFTGATRSWLAEKGFPRGVLRLSSSFVTLPGGDTVNYKTGVLTKIAEDFDITAGVGNRKTDIQAYTNAGVAPTRIFIKLPEFTSEVKPELDAHHAVGFTDYAQLSL